MQNEPFFMFCIDTVWNGNVIHPVPLIFIGLYDKEHLDSDKIPTLLELYYYSRPNEVGPHSDDALAGCYYSIGPGSIRACISS